MSNTTGNNIPINYHVQYTEMNSKTLNYNGPLLPWIMHPKLKI